MSGRLMATAEETGVGAFHLFWGGSLATIFSAICSILIARLLGPELYGLYSLSFIVYSFLMIFTDFGISQANIRFIANYISQEKRNYTIPIFKISLLFNLVISFIVFSIGFIFSDKLTIMLLNRFEIISLVRLTLILIIIQSITIIIGNTLLGLGDMKGYAMIDVIRQIFRIILSPTLIILGLSVLGAIMGYIIAFIAGFITSLIL